MKLFVYIHTQTGPSPQIWYERPVDGDGKPKIKPLVEYQLFPDEDNLTLRELMLKYPFEKSVTLKNWIETILDWFHASDQ